MDTRMICKTKQTFNGDNTIKNFNFLYICNFCSSVMYHMKPLQWQKQWESHKQKQIIFYHFYKVSNVHYFYYKFQCQNCKFIHNFKHWKIILTRNYKIKNMYHLRDPNINDWDSIKIAVYTIIVQLVQQ